MKRIFFIAALAASILSSCVKGEELRTFDDETAECFGNGTITLALGDALCGTKVASEHPDWEKTIKRLEVLIFKDRGEIYRYFSFAEDSLFSGRITLHNVNKGIYRMAVVANASEEMNLKSLHDIGELYGKRRFSLTDCHYGSSLVMMTSQEFSKEKVAVSEGDTSEISVVLERPVSRVSLSRISNSLPMTITIENVMLTNVADTLSPDGKNISWINRQGRADSCVRISSHIIEGDNFPASAPDFTFRKVGKDIQAGSSLKDVLYLYGCGNSSGNEPGGFTAEFSPEGEKTCMVVTASIAGRRCYYPVVLDSMKANTSYDFKLTLSDKGSDDPDIPLKTGSVSYTVTMTEWDLSHSYNDKI